MLTGHDAGLFRFRQELPTSRRNPASDLARGVCAWRNWLSRGCRWNTVRCSAQCDRLSLVDHFYGLTRRHGHGAVPLFAAVLLVRAIVPAGYIIGSRDGVPTIELCHGMAAAAPHDMASMAHHGETPDAPADGTVLCAFAAANFAPILVAEPLPPLATVSIAVMQPVFSQCAMVFVPSAFPHARPFLRGPPALS
jgi:hypothetical protein